MKLPTVSKIASCFIDLHADFPEQSVLVLFQIQLTIGLWVICSKQLICHNLPANAEPALTDYAIQFIVWCFIGLIGVHDAIINIMFANILRYGVLENRKAYVASWLTYAFLCWTVIFLQLLYITPWMPVNIVLVTVSGLILPSVFSSLRSVQKRKQQENISNTKPSTVQSGDLEDKVEGPTELEAVVYSD